MHSRTNVVKSTLSRADLASFIRSGAGVRYDGVHGDFFQRLREAWGEMCAARLTGGAGSELHRGAPSFPHGVFWMTCAQISSCWTNHAVSA